MYYYFFLLLVASVFNAKNSLLLLHYTIARVIIQEIISRHTAISWTRFFFSLTAGAFRKKTFLGDTRRPNTQQ